MGISSHDLKIRIFTVSYIVYAMYYLGRMNFSVALPAIASDLGFSKVTLGLIGGVFSIVYAVGQLVNGQLVERFGAKRIVTLGLLLSAVANLLFGYVEVATLMILIWAVNGYAQSTGWSSVVKVISEWFNRSSRGGISGLFGTCFLVGSMISLTFSSYILTKFGWKVLFLLPPIIFLFLVTLFNLTVKEGKTRRETVKVATIDRLFLSRRIAAFAAAYVLLQFVRSGFELWAPSYIFEVYGIPLEYAGLGAAIIPIGGVVGSVLAGWASDKLSGARRAPVMAVMTSILALTLIFLYRSVEAGFFVNEILLFLGGITLYGPHVLMVTTIPMDYDSRYGAARIAGFIDGLGYIGSTFANPFVGWLVDSRGWSAAVTFWTVSTLLATLLTTSLWIKGRGPLYDRLLSR